MARPVTDPELRCIVYYLFEECGYTAPVLGEFFNLSESAIYSRVAQGRDWAKYHRTLYSSIKSVLSARGYHPKKELSHLKQIPELAEYIPSVISEEKGLDCIVDSIIDNPDQYSLQQTKWLDFNSNQLVRLWKMAIHSTNPDINLLLLGNNQDLAKRVLFKQDMLAMFNSATHSIYSELMDMRDINTVCKLLDDIYSFDDKTFVGRIADILNVALRTHNNSFDPIAVERINREGWKIRTSVHGQPQLVKDKHVIWF